MPVLSERIEDDLLLRYMKQNEIDIGYRPFTPSNRNRENL